MQSIVRFLCLFLQDESASNKIKILLYLRHVNKCILLTEQNCIKSVKFGGDMEYKI
jgi:hypothetical protein